MTLQTKQLRKEAQAVVESEGLSWRRLLRSAKQIIVFGSHAVGLESPSSDFDLLCVGQGSRFKSRKVHLIWIGEDRFKRRSWLGGELATHVSRYGKWIKGRKPWSRELRPDRKAVARKQKRVNSRVKAMRAEWSRLLPAFQRKQLSRLRRDIQRLVYLKRREPMPPTRLLDAQWADISPESSAWSALLNNVPRLRTHILQLLAKNVPKHQRRPRGGQ